MATRQETTRAAMLVAVALASAACAARSTASRDDPFADAEDRPQVQLIVRNHNFYQARIYSVSAFGRKVLGTVDGSDRAVYTFEWEFPEQMQVQMDLFTGPTCYTEWITVDPGDVLEVEISSNLEMMNCRSDPGR